MADTLTDAKGRKIELRVLDPADMLDLLEAAGSASSNAGWIRYASVVCSVSAIDGVPAPLASSKPQILALARRLGNDGFAAVGNHLFGDGAAAKVEEVAKN